MTWQEVCEDPSLQDLPYKIELNEYGQIVMSPASNEHGYFQSRICTLLSQFMSAGKVLSECSVDTPKGVKVADAAWLSESFVRKHGYKTPYPEAPEICVEISSPSNSEQELSLKMKLYFGKGAKEVWVCDAFGNIEFFDGQGEIKKSRLAPGFPSRV